MPDLERKLCAAQSINQPINLNADSPSARIVDNNYFRTIILRVLCAGERRLEVRRNGLGQTILVDIHTGRVRGHGGYYPTSAHAVRRPDTDR